MSNLKNEYVYRFLKGIWIKSESLYDNLIKLRIKRSMTDTHIWTEISQKRE